jgi:hypothetical protein
MRRHSDQSWATYAIAPQVYQVETWNVGTFRVLHLVNLFLFFYFTVCMVSFLFCLDYSKHQQRRLDAAQGMGDTVRPAAFLFSNLLFLPVFPMGGLCFVVPYEVYPKLDDDVMNEWFSGH